MGRGCIDSSWEAGSRGNVHVADGFGGVVEEGLLPEPESLAADDLYPELR